MVNAPLPSPSDTDADHLRLLSIFHYSVGGLTVLFACFPVIHLIIGLFLVFAPDKFGHGSNQPPAFFGWFFVVFASFIILIGWAIGALIMVSGKFLARRVNYMYCFVIACLECLMMPFGTVLGVFTIVVLNRPTVKAAFAARPGI
jgi:hypothetical protein